MASITPATVSQRRGSSTPSSRSFPRKSESERLEATLRSTSSSKPTAHVRDVQVIKSSAENTTNKKDLEVAPLLDQKAVEAASQYRFKPATFHGKPVPIELRIEMNFQIF
jgi:hypothetical protein